MRKIHLLFIAALMTAFNISCTKSSTDPPDPPSADKYTVKYQVNLTGEYTDFKLVYYETGSVKKEITSITSPWEKSFDNFVVGDSVVMYFSFMSVVDHPTSFVYSTKLYINDVLSDIITADSIVDAHPPTSIKIESLPALYKIAE